MQSVFSFLSASEPNLKVRSRLKQKVSERRSGPIRRRDGSVLVTPLKKRTLELTGEQTTDAWAKRPSKAEINRSSIRKKDRKSQPIWCLIYTPMSFNCGRSSQSVLAGCCPLFKHFLFSSHLDSSANESPAGSGPSSPIGLCSNENGATYRTSTNQIEVPRTSLYKLN